MSNFFFITLQQRTPVGMSLGNLIIQEHPALWLQKVSETNNQSTLTILFYAKVDEEIALEFLANSEKAKEGAPRILTPNGNG